MQKKEVGEIMDKRFKKQKDLIKYACKCAIYHQDVEIPARMKAARDFIRKPVDFLKECAMKLRMPR